MAKSLLFCIALFPCLLFAELVIIDEYKNDISSLIVKDISKKQILYSKDIKQRMRPASLTKIMTAMLAIESGKMNKIVTITKEATRAEPTKLGLKVGERIYLRDLVKATLISSANDAAIAIGIYVGGSTKKFVTMMNRKARSIGMHNTRFTNAAGFDIGEHYSTALDLMKLAEYAIKNKTFNQIVKINLHTFRSVDSKRPYIVRTSNRLLKERKYAIGVKTGYTSKAGACLIARGKNENKDILLVMLNSKSRRWESAAAILDAALGKNVQSVQQSHADKNPHVRYVTPY